MKKVIYTAIGLLLIGCVAHVFGSGPKIGTNAAPELQIPIGARGVALSGGYIANVTGVEAIYWNPAGLSVGKSEVAFNYLNYFADMQMTNLAAGVQVGRVGALGVNVQVLNIGGIPITTIEAPEGTGETLKPNYITVGATFARRFTDRINFGANAKLISESVGNMRASTAAFDLGLQYISPWNVSFGVVLRNLGGQMSFNGTSIEFDTSVPWSNPNATTRKTKLDMSSSELPTSMSLGLGYRYEIGSLQHINISGAYANNSYNLDHLAAGIEYDFKEMIFLRGGYAAALYPEDYPGSKSDDYQFGLCMGLGLYIPVGNTTVKVDYAYRDMQLFDANQYFSVGFAF
jgi:hypothetical protein